MKKLLVFLVAALITTAGCEKDEEGKTGSKGLSLYWDHQIFNERGRGYIFEFYEAERSDILYELKFGYKIDNIQKSIDVYLLDKVNMGKCPSYPMPCLGDDSDCGDFCTSNGDFFIPEDRISEGNYKFTIKTLNYTVQAEIVFAKDKATLNIPDNSYFSCPNRGVFVTPANLLYGGVLYTEKENETFALDFMEDLRSLGMRDTVVTNPPIKVDEAGMPIIEFWEPDNYHFPFLLTMDAEFSTIIELAKIHFAKSPINIYLFSTNGDQARIDSEGVDVRYAVQK